MTARGTRRVEAAFRLIFSWDKILSGSFTDTFENLFELFPDYLRILHGSSWVLSRFFPDPFRFICGCFRILSGFFPDYFRSLSRLFPVVFRILSGFFPRFSICFPHSFRILSGFVSHVSQLPDVCRNCCARNVAKNTCFVSCFCFVVRWISANKYERHSSTS